MQTVTKDTATDTEGNDRTVAHMLHSDANAATPTETW